MQLMELIIGRGIQLVIIPREKITREVTMKLIIQIAAGIIIQLTLLTTTTLPILLTQVTGPIHRIIL